MASKKCVLFHFLGFFNWEGKMFSLNAYVTAYQCWSTNKIFCPIQKRKLLKPIPSRGQERHWVTFSWICSLCIYCMWWPGLGSWLVSKNYLDCNLISAHCRYWSTHPIYGEQCHRACYALVTFLSICVLRRCSAFLNILISFSQGLLPL